MDMATSYTLSNEIVNNERDKAIDRYTGVGFRYSDAKQRVEKDFQRMMKKESSLRAYMQYYSFIIGMIFFDVDLLVVRSCNLKRETCTTCTNVEDTFLYGP